MNLEVYVISWLAASLFRPLVPAVLAWLFLRLFRIEHPGSRHTVWTFVLIAMLLVPFSSLMVPHLELSILPAPASPALFESIPDQPDPVSFAAAPRVSGGAADPPASASPARAVSKSIPTATLIVVVYLAGVLGMCLYTAAGWFLLRRILTRSSPLRIPPLRESGDVAVPVTAGWLRPVILFPRDWRQWSRQTRHAALAHELAHIRRKDAFVFAFARGARALLWFHPLAWWLLREISHFAELACDISVLEQGHDPAGYSRVLAEFASRVSGAGGRAAFPTLAMAAPRGLRRRIDQAFSFSPGNIRKIRRPAAVLVMCGIPALCLAAMVGVTARVSIPAPAVPVRGAGADQASLRTPAAATVTLAQAQSRGNTATVAAPAPVPAKPALQLAASPMVVPAQAASKRQLTIFDRQGNLVTTVGEYGWDEQISLSPDGTRIAVSSSEGDNDIWVVNIATGQRTRITSGAAPERSPVWSPDGTQIAYVAFHEGSFDVYRKASDGTGSEELLYSHHGDQLALSQWSEDGRYLCVFTPVSAVYVLPLEGERKLVELARGPFTYGGHISPDGRLFSYHSGEKGPVEIYVHGFDAATARLLPGERVSATSGRTARLSFWSADSKQLSFYNGVELVATEVAAGPPVQAGIPKVIARFHAIPPNGATVVTGGMSRDGQRFAFALPPPPPTQQLNVYDRQGRALRTLGQSSYWNQAAFSPDGNHVAAVKYDPAAGTTEIWNFDLTIGSGGPVTSDGTSHASPVWSSDGHQIAYVSFRNGAAGIYRKPSDGTGGEELLYRHPAGPGIVLTDWSADGKLMSFWSQNSLYSLPLDGSGRASVIYREDANNRGGRFSPDARYLAYNSDRSGHLETYVTPFAATAGSISPGIQVSNAGGVGGVAWRQDQRELYFLSSNGAVMAADITPGPGIKASAPRVLFRLAQPVNGPGQLSGISTRDGQRFVFVENSR